VVAGELVNRDANLVRKLSQFPSALFQRTPLGGIRKLVRRFGFIISTPRIDKIGKPGPCFQPIDQRDGSFF